MKGTSTNRLFRNVVLSVAAIAFTVMLSAALLAHEIDQTSRVIWPDLIPIAVGMEAEGIERGRDLDVFIADRAVRGHGIGPATLDALRGEVFSTTLATAVAVFAPIANEAAVRAYERAGFVWRHIWHDPASGPMWLLICERPLR